MADEMNTFDRWLLFQHAVRTFMPVLEMNEWKVFCFIMDRTIGWGKTSEWIRIDEMVYGIPGSGGTGMGRTSVKGALAGLKSKGAVFTVRSQRGYQYTINFNWEPRGSRVIKVPKKAQMVSTHKLNDSRESDVRPSDGRMGDHQMVGRATHRWSEIDPLLINRNQEKENRTSQSEQAAPAASAKEIISSFLAEAKERAGRKQAAALAKAKPSALDLFELWRGAMAASYPKAVVAPWSKKVQGQVKWLRDHVVFENATLGVFLCWVVESWERICAAKFPAQGMKSRSDFRAPETPEIGFVLGLRQSFLEAWSARETLRDEIALTGPERQMRALRRRGLTQDEAEAEMAAREESSKTRRDMEAERRELERKRKMLEVAQQTALRKEIARGVSSSRATRVRPPLDLTAGEIQPIEGDSYDR